jgi:diguanylate cyclase (GGDEF)-like protein
MLGQFAEATVQKRALEEQLRILDSMAGIYDHVNLINFTESTEMSLRKEPLVRLPLAPGQDHTQMTTGLLPRIAPDMQDSFWEFTDLTTVAQRLVNQKSISCEYLSTENVWFRAQYINVDSRQGHRPEIVIYTVQNIDADKRREEALIRKSTTDGLTHINNRLSYEEAIEQLRILGPSGDLAVISADVNSLKQVNDQLGHAAGDELIQGAAACLISAVGSEGTVYRTGGDEFTVIARTPDCAQLVRRIRSRASAWRGTRVDTVSVSIGFTAHRDHPGTGIDELVRLADESMYRDKEQYYRQSGHERRRPS